MKKIKFVVISLALVSVLTGCKSLYGKYERPDVNTQGLYRDPVSLTDTLAVTDTSPRSRERVEGKEEEGSVNVVR